MGSRIPRAKDDRTTRLSVGVLTGKTQEYVNAAGTELRTVPADGSATAATNNQLIRALIADLIDKGILTEGA